MNRQDWLETADSKNGQDWLETVNRKLWMKQVRDTNQYTQKYGLVLSEQDAEMLIAEKSNILKEQRRVEFGPGVLLQIIEVFCDSSFISQQDYVGILIRLQEIFFLYKNEMQDEISDEELLNFMKEQFENVCYGDLEYLENTCLEIFAEAIRAGYRGYISSRGKSEFLGMDIVKRWDRNLYIEALKNLED